MVTKVVHYRRFEPASEAWSRGSLQNMVAEALSISTAGGIPFGQSWRARTFHVPNGENLRRFSHNIIATAESIFGTLCLYSPDDWAPVLKRELAPEPEHRSVDDTLREVEIAERPPLEGEDYLRGIAYWLIVQDHLFVVQHISLQTKAFEEYFDAFLRAALGLSDTERFALRSVFNKEIAGGDLGEIVAVEVGGVVGRTPVVPLSGQATVQEVEEQRTLGRTVSRFDKAVDVLKAMFGEPNAESILQSIPVEAELEVDVRFGYRTRKREVSRAALENIARAARNLPDGEVIAIGKNGRQIGDDLRLSLEMPFRLLREKGALLVLEDARLQLGRVYQRFVEDGKI
jgi:hypothetical protein